MSVAGLCKLQRGFDITQATGPSGVVPVYSSSGISYFTKHAKVLPPAIVTGRKGKLGLVYLVAEPFWPHDTTLWGNEFSDNVPEFVAYALRNFGLERLDAATSVPTLNRNNLKEHSIAIPQREEQQAIAAALSDADGMVAGLERVIAKKRLIKQGAMQDLLTARRRLPGFSGEWEVKPFAQIARIRNTKVQTLGNPVAENCIELEQVESETGRILYWADATNRATVKYQFEPDDVLFGRLRPYLRKFHRANIQGICSTEIWPLMTQGIDGGFLYQVIQSDGFIAAACESYGTHMPRADWGKIAIHQIQVPVDRKEQQAIGEVLADMESEIQTLESRLAKARAVKEGMMQNLLTGRVRLV